MSQTLIFLVLGPALLETLVLFFRPTLLAGMAFLDVGELGEHRFTLRSPRLTDGDTTNYREQARVAVPLPQLEGRTELSDAVLFCDGSRIALRRAYGFGRRQMWLVALAVQREGDVIVIRAKQAIVPVSMLLLVPYAVLAVPVGLPSLIVVVGIPFSLLLGHFFGAGSRAVALNEAYAHLEAELRRALEARPEARAVS